MMSVRRRETNSWHAIARPTSPVTIKIRPITWTRTPSSGESVTPNTRMAPTAITNRLTANLMLRVYPSSTKSLRDNTFPLQPCTTQDEHRRNARRASPSQCCNTTPHVRPLRIGRRTGPAQVRAGGRHSRDDPLLTSHELRCHPGQHTRPATAEQPNPVEAQLHRIAITQRRHSRGYGGLVAGPQNSVGKRAVRVADGCDSTLGPPRCSHRARSARSERRSKSSRPARHASADQMSGMLSDLLDLSGGNLQQLRPEIDQCPRRRDLLADQRLIRVDRVSVRVAACGHRAVLPDPCGRRRVGVPVVLVELD